MKTCKDCNESLPLEEFYTYRRADNVTYYARCKPCHRDKMKGSMDPARKAEIRRASRQKAQDYINNVKSKPCADCGKTYPPYVMDLDHVSGEKFQNIAKMVGRYAFAQVMKEVEKCEVVCANCHRERTWSRR